MAPQTPIKQRVIRELLNARAPDDLARFYVFPMPTQIGDHLTIYQTPADLAQGYVARAEEKARQGQSALQTRVAAVELPRNNRFRVWVDWLFTDPQGNPGTGERTVYFCSLLRGNPAVEMIQCLGSPGQRETPKIRTIAAVG
jgi:hypothetical protein